MKPLLASLSLTLLLTSCIGGAPTTPDTPPASETPDSTAQIPETLKPLEIELVASKHRFQPNSIKAKSGQQVILNLRTTDVPHGITIPGLRLASSIMPNKEQQLQFIAPAPGVYEFYSNIPSGPGYEKMRGTLTVTE